MTTQKHMRAISALVSAAMVAAPFALALPAHAAVADWHQAATIVPKSTTDFASDGFKESLRNLRDTGANYVGLVVPYYQSNIYSTDLSPGWNTPTDESLVAAIDYAHSLGLGVTLKPHAESYDGAWRAYINPGDREGWFRAYGGHVLHLAELAQTHGVEMIALGTEMVSMASSQMHSENTQRWIDLIQQVRSVYGGKLTYGANSTNNDDSQFLNEKKYIGFWSYLDYAGLSVYYGLNSGGDVAGMKGAWDYWNNNDIRWFAQSVGKPVLFLEIGYRSLENAHHDPWNWGRGGNADPGLQANAYEALMSYWNDYPYIVGVYWWDWESNPNAGGGGTDYTPQHKPAQDVMARWFTNPESPGQPPGGGTIAFTSSAQAASGSAGAPVALSARVKADGAAGVLVDVEVYNAAGQKVHQHFYPQQQFAAGEEHTYHTTWTPSADGTYRMAVGVFTQDWSHVYHWNNDAAMVVIGGNEAPPPPQQNVITHIWWPTDGASLSGTQPLKANLEGRDDTESYRMYWQVDGGSRVEMYNSDENWPHKEAWVDFTGWRWKGSGPYTLTFVSIDHGGTVISQKSVDIYTN